MCLHFCNSHREVDNYCYYYLFYFLLKKLTFNHMEICMYAFGGLLSSLNT